MSGIEQPPKVSSTSPGKGRKACSLSFPMVQRDLWGRCHSSQRYTETGKSPVAVLVKGKGVAFYIMHDGDLRKCDSMREAHQAQAGFCQSPIPGTGPRVCPIISHNSTQSPTLLRQNFWKWGSYHRPIYAWGRWTCAHSWRNPDLPRTDSVGRKTRSSYDVYAYVSVGLLNDEKTIYQIGFLISELDEVGPLRLHDVVLRSL
ncbi:hypothetical protein BDV27DRAFT_95983 [Aspergillus caelatus]|uniref:Uncharacterized protein n=1 Tax=Aspergillus caelatus TaxID=61420 RepID=A0A5N7A8D5_9EURO|nr:uncharacterized protein BDV27DRAFT_95983 [Aspergillus caelatus]KAE8366082.1 hypothetical protein BDV27DRAFT_95983 [Aspergillus caelatus]